MTETQELAKSNVSAPFWLMKFKEKFNRQASKWKDGLLEMSWKCLGKNCNRVPGACLDSLSTSYMWLFFSLLLVLPFPHSFEHGSWKLLKVYQISLVNGKRLISSCHYDLREEKILGNRFISPTCVNHLLLGQSPWFCEWGHVVIVIILYYLHWLYDVGRSSYSKGKLGRN